MTPYGQTVSPSVSKYELPNEGDVTDPKLVSTSRRFYIKTKMLTKFINSVQVSLINCQEYHSIFCVLHNGVHPF